MPCILLPSSTVKQKLQLSTERLSKLEGQLIVTSIFLAKIILIIDLRHFNKNVYRLGIERNRNNITTQIRYIQKISSIFAAAKIISNN
jgi:hypothetical protein